ncbi:hypothetical protein HDF10_002339 [Edaphobacter lichenicola]|uniref:Uncharacterized protein n=1 Tax=Tunturiibacter lichenicola TaxID=2051959 RepID=A0A7W8N5U3_9BACT|nr:hypothetical protein [Edaphobacter lichenicola]
MNSLILRPLNVPQTEGLFVIQHGSDGGWHSFPRSACPGQCRSDDAAAGTGSYMDPYPTRTRSRSSDLAAGGVTHFRIQVAAYRASRPIDHSVWDRRKLRSASSFDANRVSSYERVSLNLS